MNLRFWFFSTLLSAALCAAPCAQAQTRVGEAVVIQNNVVRVAATTTPISVGDSMLRDETVRTGADSAARFVMADSTNLSLGPSATIKLDRTVYNDEHSYREIAIRLTAGAFRFVGALLVIEDFPLALVVGAGDANAVVQCAQVALGA